jgi:histidinol-phosphate phosphatase family protein
VNKSQKQLVVLAGGDGTRLVSAGIKIPKLLLKIQNLTIFEIIVNEAISEGFTEILWCLGYGHTEIEDQIKAKQSLKSSLKHRLFVEEERRGTLGALIQARAYLQNDFCLTMGDLLLSRTNIGGMFEGFRKAEEDVRLLVKYTDHPEDSDLVILNADLSVNSFNAYPHGEIPKIPVGNAGIVFLKKKHVPTTLDDSKSDVFKKLIPKLISENLVIKAAFHQGVIRDIGTPDRLQKASSRFAESGKLSNLTGIFFDRDGTLNIESGHISSRSQIKLFPETSKILKFATEKFDLVGIVTNQPVVSRGEATIETVNEINSHLLISAGVADSSRFIIKVCPHHQDSGFVGEIPELKIDCICRKPSSGMLLEILNEQHLRANNVIYVGNSISDLQAAAGVGIEWIHLITNDDSDCDMHTELRDGVCMDHVHFIRFLEARSGIRC